MIENSSIALESQLNNSTTVRAKNKTIPTPIRSPWLLRRALGMLGGISPATAARCAGLLFRSPRKFPAPARERAWLESATRLNLTVGHRRVHAWSWGEGDQVVVLSHGWEGRGSQLGIFAQPLVEAGYRVVAPDFPAHGRSDGQRSSLPEFVDVIWALHRRLSPRRPLRAVIAHSMGSMATTIAVAEGLPVERVVLIAPPHDVETVVRRFAGFVGISEDVRDRMQRAMEAEFGRAMADFDISKLSREMQAVAEQRAVPDMLLVHDQCDRLVPHADGVAVARAWPPKGFVATTGLGHQRILRDPQVVREIIDHVVLDFAGDPNPTSAAQSAQSRPAR